MAAKHTVFFKQLDLDLDLRCCQCVAMVGVRMARLVAMYSAVAQLHAPLTVLHLSFPVLFHL